MNYWRSRISWREFVFADFMINREVRYIFLGLVLVVLGQTSPLNSLRQQVRSLMGPLLFGAQRIGGIVEEQLSFYSSLGSLYRENQKLSSELITLRSEVTELSGIRRENELYRNQLGLPLSKQWRILPVEMSGYEDFDNKSYMTLKRGEYDGIKPGMLVVYQNFLIGEVTVSDRNMSRLQLIFSSDFHIPVLDMDSPDRSRGVARGLPPDRLVMTKILPEERMAVGDVIVTSGEGAPSGLVLGRVEVLAKEEDGILRRAILKPEVNINRLETVFVLLDEKSN